MVRIMIKGGVWKNTEDEVLKAAVMKYGKNQWARVASLLNRKSAKQCKARWYEWLDPSIRKTEWAREEEEKLLHLAKLYPCQWRTIAPIVGRTAAQCMEHYERLLDKAQARLGGEGDEAGGPGADGDPRRLRPGEIDPAPETKPARPDPVDMDDDEKEMLSEARARLANTRGKKAKRKAREKQLGEAKRLASLQKRRELKAAGIETTRGAPKRKYIDYAREVPFQRLAPAGFFDTAGEKSDAAEAAKRAGDTDFEAVRQDQLEAKRRDVEEREEERKDRKKLKRMMEQNLPQSVVQVARLNDPDPSRRRHDLALPEPQVSEREMEDIVKLGASARALPESARSSDVTASLVGEYRAATAMPTPGRTPAAGAGADVVLQEAQNAIAMRGLDTPLLGQEQATELQPGTGFAGAAPLTSKMATPSVLVGPMGGAAAGATPLLTGGASVAPSVAPGATPMRDEFGINRDDDDASVMSASDAASSVTGGAAARRGGRGPGGAALRDALAGLPAPKYDYDIIEPEVPADDRDVEDAARAARGTSDAVTDAADIAAANEAARSADELAALARRSAAVRRALPRPETLPARAALAAPSAAERGGVVGESDALLAADALVRAEVAKLLHHDAIIHPPALLAAGGSKKRKRKAEAAAAAAASDAPALEDFDDAALAAARAAIAADAEEAAAARREAGGDDDDAAAAALFADAWLTEHAEWGYAPGDTARRSLADAKKAERVAALEAEHAALRAKTLEIAGEKGRLGKLETKLAVTTKGYVERAAKLRDELVGAADARAQGADLARVHAHMASLERRALPARKAEARAALSRERERERGLQAEYAALLRERDALYQRAYSQKAAEEPAQNGAAT